MANRLKMALIDAILSLKARRWSNRRIASELDVDRETVARQSAACRIVKCRQSAHRLHGGAGGVKCRQSAHRLGDDQANTQRV